MKHSVTLIEIEPRRAGEISQTFRIAERETSAKGFKRVYRPVECRLADLQAARNRLVELRS